MLKLPRLKSGVAYSVITFFLAAYLMACTSKSPPCPNTAAVKPAESAGCLVIDQQKVLVIAGIAGFDDQKE